MSTLAKLPEKKAFKYPAEEEYLVRRLGAAVLASWATLPDDVKARILDQAVLVWDRERDIPKLPQKLDTFVKRHPGRVG